MKESKKNIISKKSSGNENKKSAEKESTAGKSTSEKSTAKKKKRTRFLISKPTLKKGKLSLSSTKVILLCCGVIGVCLVLLLVTTIGENISKKESRKRTPSITERFEKDDSQDNSERNKNQLRDVIAPSEEELIAKKSQKDNESQKSNSPKTETEPKLIGESFYKDEKPSQSQNQFDSNSESQTISDAEKKSSNTSDSNVKSQNQIAKTIMEKSNADTNTGKADTTKSNETSNTEKTDTTKSNAITSTEKTNTTKSSTTTNTGKTNTKTNEETTAKSKDNRVASISQPSPKTSEKSVTQTSPKQTNKFNFPAAVKNAELVFLFDDGGQSVSQLKAFLNLPIPITVAVLPKLEYSAECAELVRKSGNEVMLHQPMQAVDSSVNPGPGAIKPDMTSIEIALLVQSNIDEIAPISGMNNHEGSLITADESKIRVVLDTAAENGIFFLDSRTNVDTKVPAASRKVGYSWYERNGRFLDNEKTRDEFLTELRKNLDIANKSGSVIMIGHIWSADYLPDLIREVYPELKEKGYTFKTVSGSSAKRR